MRVPKRLKGHALAKWHEVVPALEELGLIRQVESDTVELYCETYRIWMEAEEKIATTGSIARDGKGAIIISPWVEIRDRAADRLITLAQQLGISPGARRVPLMPDFAEFMAHAELDDDAETEDAA